MGQTVKTDRSHYPVRKTTLAEQDLDLELDDTTMEERLGMMWQLALDAWAWGRGPRGGKPVAQSRLPRHTLRVRKYRR